MDNFNKIFRYPFLFIIFIYQKIISPYLGKKCRFIPTCSEYTKQAIIKYGIIKGIRLGLLRLKKCHPWGGTGYDPLV